MIIKFIASNPLNPSMRFAPFIINKKHNKTKIVEKKLFCKKEVKKGISILEIVIGKKQIRKVKKKIINNNLGKGFILILISSKKPTKNMKKLIKIYSYKISE